MDALAVTDATVRTGGVLYSSLARRRCARAAAAARPAAAAGGVID